MTRKDLGPFTGSENGHKLPAMNATISDIMHSPVMTLTPHQSVGHARDLMQHLHHVVVVERGADGTDEVTGMVSSFDLLRLVEDHRFVMKHAPTPSKRANARS